MIVIARLRNREFMGNNSNDIADSSTGLSFICIRRIFRRCLLLGFSGMSKTSRSFCIFSYLRLWIFQVYSLICDIYEHCSFIYSLQTKRLLSETSTTTSPLIQIIGEDGNEVRSAATPSSSNSHAYDKEVLGKSPFLSLSTLHTLTSSLLESHLSEISHRWMLPLFDAQIYLLRHLSEHNLGSVSKSVLSECELCFTCFATM